MRQDSMKSGKCFGNSVYAKFQQRQTSAVKLTSTDLYYSLNSAVVSIFSTFPINPVLQFDELYQTGSGFFVASDLVMTAASVVFLNGYTRDPPTFADVEVARAKSYRVRVQNVAQTGDAYFYEAQLKYVSPSFDLALLEILPPIDDCTPSLGRHPVLHWGESRCLAIGEKVYTIGDYLNHQTMGIGEGTVIDNVYNDNFLGPDTNDDFNRSYWGFEGVLSSNEVRSGNVGGPLLNEYGRVVGVISGLDNLAATNSTDVHNGFFNPNTNNDTSRPDQPPVNPGYDGIYYGSPYSARLVRTVSVSQHVAQKISQIFLAGPADKCTGGYLKLTKDIFGNYYRFVYSYLGITRYEAFGLKHLNLLPDSKYRRQRGFILLGTENDSPVGRNTVLDDDGPFPNIFDGTLPVTPDNELYLLTSMNGNVLGVGDGQVTFSTITRLHVDSDLVEIRYRLGSENFGKSHALQVELKEMPAASDLPPNFVTTNAIARSLRIRDQERDSVNRGLGGEKKVEALNRLANRADRILEATGQLNLGNESMVAKTEPVGSDPMNLGESDSDSD